MRSIVTALYTPYYWLVAIPLLVATTIVCSTVAIAGCSLKGGRIFGYWPGWVWSRIMLLVFLCPTRVRGKEHLPKRKTQCMVMANHQSSLDIFLMYAKLPIPFRWVMKASLRKVPFMGKTCEMAGCIFVDNSTPSGIKDTMDQARALLQTGTSIFIFPEGSRTLDGKMDRFKKGGFVLAHELNIPIIPVSIDGNYRALPAKHYQIRPQRLTLTIHPPIYPDTSLEMPKSVLKTLASVQGAIASALPSEEGAQL